MRDPRPLLTGLASRSRVLVLPVALWLVVGLPASAAEITVGGSCTLAHAITAANTDAASGGCPAGSSLEADELVLTGSVTLTSELPTVTSTLDIKGNGFTIKRAGSAPSFRIFNVDSGTGGVLGIENTTLSNGGGKPGFKDTNGGAIYVYSGGVSLRASTVSNSYAYSGGAIAVQTGAGVSLANSTLSGNEAVRTGGGLYSDGFASITIASSTISGNTAGYDYGGGIFAGFASISFSTLSGNTGNVSGPAVTSISVFNSLIANSANASGANCDVSVFTLADDKSLADDSTCGSIPSTLTGLDPELEDNGGPTRTHALLEGSNAIDRVPAMCPGLDQRGARRPASGCDSGAYEFCVPLEIKDRAVNTGELHEACGIVLGPSLTVIGPNGHLNVTADIDVVMVDGVEVLTDGRITAGIEPFP